MKVLSLHQPWASLVVLGEKIFETRSWRTYYRGPLAIHASKGRPEEWRSFWRAPFDERLRAHMVDDLDELPRGFILGVVDLVDCIRIDGDGCLAPGFPKISALEPLSEQERAFGDYSGGRWAWKLEAPRALRDPIRASGHQGLWTYPSGLIEHGLDLAAAEVRGEPTPAPHFHCEPEEG
jgi:hypothetical protein